MGAYEHFPYTNFHDLNLDWLLKKVEELERRVEELERRVEELENP